MPVKLGVSQSDLRLMSVVFPTGKKYRYWLPFKSISVENAYDSSVSLSIGIFVLIPLDIISLELTPELNGIS